MCNDLRAKRYDDHLGKRSIHCCVCCQLYMQCGFIQNDAFVQCGYIAAYVCARQSVCLSRCVETISVETYSVGTDSGESISVKTDSVETISVVLTV